MSDELTNRVPYGPSGLVVAVQYWEGDEAAALRLARLLADIEPSPRRDATIMLARRFDTPVSDDLEKTRQYVSRKFPVMVVRSKREGSGHPNGPNALAGGVMDFFAEQWKAGDLTRAAVFLAEADGCPVSPDWLDRILSEHKAAQAEGRQITGPYMAAPPHINGTMVVSIPWWIDHPSVTVTPDGQGWDIFHGETYLRAARRTKVILNLWGSRNWTRDQLVPIAAEYAWITSVKDQSVVSWAERHIVARAGKRARWSDL